MTESNQTQKNWEIGEVTFNDQGDVQFTLRGVKVAKASDFRLISAAPELLGTLELALGQLNNDASMDSFGIAIRNRVRDVIAKAKGVK